MPRVQAKVVRDSRVLMVGIEDFLSEVQSWRSNTSYPGEDDSNKTAGHAIRSMEEHTSEPKEGRTCLSRK